MVREERRCLRGRQVEELEGSGVEVVIEVKRGVQWNRIEAAVAVGCCLGCGAGNGFVVGFLKSELREER